MAQVGKLAYDALRERYSEAWLREHHATDPDDFLVAREVETDHVVGFVVGERRDPCEGHVLALAVEPVHRGEGLGSTLLRRLQQRMRNRGAYRMSLDVRFDDIQTRGFYQRHGFQPAGLREHAYSDGTDAVRLERPI